MPRKLKVEALQAELSAVGSLLAAAREAGDPAAEYQLEKRHAKIALELEDIVGAEERRASVALFFGGRPVVGSRGVAAEFSGKVLGSFQDLVAKALAAEEVGTLGERGPVPNRRAADLIVTGVARGSFGFLLDEPAAQGELVDTHLKTVVEKAITLVEKVSSANEADFEEAVEVLDSRLLVALKDFFNILDTSGATVRFVDDVADISLDLPSVHRGRLRTEQTEIAEDEVLLTGVLVGFLPEHRKFEMRVDDGRVVYGSVSPDALEQYHVLIKDGQPPIEQRWAVRVKLRTITPLNRPPKDLYRLMSFSDRPDQAAPE